MHTPRTVSLAAGSAREHLRAGLPVVERHLELAGIATALLEGGDGPPVLLLHGPLANAFHWAGVISSLTDRHRVIVPDLPGHGASQVVDGPLDVKQVLAWLRELINATCASPPVLVGHLIGGAISARQVAEEPERARQLILVNTFGLAVPDLPPAFATALDHFLETPTADTHEEIWRHCAFDLARLRRHMGERWAAFASYNIERARAQTMGSVFATLMQHFAAESIPAAMLARIAVPTTLIWGRHDRATPLAIAAAAAARYRWPLHVIDDANDDPPVEQPAALARVLREVIGRP